MRRLGLWLLLCFPRAWRERYESEMRALLAEQPIRPVTLVDLVRGAADAHLHPGPLVGSPDERMRNSVGAAVCCWIAVVICGAGFAKLTEDPAFAAAGAAHPVLGAARLAIAVLAALSAGTVLLGGRRLIAGVVREAWSARRRPLVRAVCVPPVAVAIVAAATGVLAWLANAGGVPARSVGAVIALGSWLAIGLAGAGACGLASRAALRLAHPPAAALRAGARGAVILTLTLALMTSATGVYAVALAVDAPALAHAATGPLGLTSTTVALTVLFLLMAAVSGLAAITSARSLRALRAAR